jgi:hypothetical protein
MRHISACRIRAREMLEKFLPAQRQINATENASPTHFRRIPDPLPPDPEPTATGSPIPPHLIPARFMRINTPR